MNATESLELLAAKAGSLARATKRLREAAGVVAGKIEDAAWEAGLLGKNLPRGYYVSQQNWRGQAMGTFWLYKETGRVVETDWGESYRETFCVDGCGGYFAGDFNYEMPEAPTAAQLRIFADDLAAGLLAEIAAFCAAKAEAAEKAAETLEVQGA